MAKNDKPRKDGNSESPESPGTHTPEPVSVRERDEFVTHLIGKEGTPLDALKKIAGEQLKMRNRTRAAEKNAEELKELVPDKDSVVIKGEEAKAYKVIKEKGFTLDKVPAELAKIPDLEKKATSSSRDTELTDAAGSKYIKSVLSTLLGDKALRFKDVPQMKADKSGLETVKGAFVVTKDGDKEVETSLDEYIEKNHKDFKQVLLVKDQQKNPTPNKEAQSGARMPRQVATNQSSQGEPETVAVVDRVLSKTFQTPSQRRAAAEKKSA